MPVKLLGKELAKWFIRKESNMANYLISHYKGKYRIKCDYDKRTNQFPRKIDGTFEDVDCYIDCYNNIKIFHYGKLILEAYIPSTIRGKNMIKSIKEEYGDDIIFSIKETESEVLFRFCSKDMDKLEKYLKPKTNGADISPFSSKNLPKNKDYKIPDEDFVEYKKIIENIGQKRIIELTHMTNKFLKLIVTKTNTLENIKTDMLLKGLSGNKYIHSIGRWNDYINYLKNELKI